MINASKHVMRQMLNVVVVAVVVYYSLIFPLSLSHSFYLSLAGWQWLLDAA